MADIKMDKSELIQALHFYFSTNRPRYFKLIESTFVDNFNSIIENCNVEESIYISTHLFLLVYTLADEYKNIQDYIYERIAIPYHKWIMSTSPSKDHIFEPDHQSQDYLFLARHAITRGMYSPGQTTYFICRLLLQAGNGVTILTPGSIDFDFRNLQIEFPKLKFVQIDQSQGFLKNFNLIEQLCLNTKFKKILTDQEFSEISYIATRHRLNNTILISSGYYRVPWYGKIFKPNVLGQPQNEREIATPMPIDLRLLNPKVPKKEIEDTKQKLGISKNDIVFGCFARLEKFNSKYVELAKCILDRVPQSKLLIAGTNSDSFLKEALSDYIAKKRAIILGFSDAHILGHILSFGLETTPTLSGSSVLELYAKGKPVITCGEGVTDLGYIAEARVPELVFQSPADIMSQIDRINSDQWNKQMSRVCLSFVEKMEAECKIKYYELLQSA